MKRSIDALIKTIADTVWAHELAPGCFARWRMNDGSGRDMGSSEYGCADAANILYSIGHFHRDPAYRAACVAELQRFQHPDGTFAEPTHHMLHGSAHCIAALELFDAAPALPLTWHMQQFGTPEKLTAFMESLSSQNDPWAHQGAGMYAAMALACDMPVEWHDAYFDWLAAHADPVTGVGMAGCWPDDTPMLRRLVGWFHYMFNHLYARRPFPFARQLVDSMLDAYDGQLVNDPTFGRAMSFHEVDWAFLLNRASMATGHRRTEALDRLRHFAAGYLDWMEGDLQNAAAARFDDLHTLFGAVCCLAELQLALPGEIITSVPLKNVLDRRPFI